MTVTPEKGVEEQLRSLMEDRILILDGAMGSMVQTLGFDETAVRGDRFANHTKDLKNFADVLCLTQPEAITDIHRQFYAAGADIVVTNTFCSSRVGAEAFDLDDGLLAEINHAAVACARAAAEEFSKQTSNKPRFVAGSIGPTAKQLSFLKAVDDDASSSALFDMMAESYYRQVGALADAGVDILLAETVVDTLNLNACLFAITRFFADSRVTLPVMVSGAFNEDGATYVSGQTVAEFWNAIADFPILSVGMNCGSDPTAVGPHLEELSRVASAYVSCHPSAGLPNEMGDYDLAPAAMAKLLKDYADNGWLNIVGGCCGSTPPHIAAIHDALKTVKPRKRTASGPRDKP